MPAAFPMMEALAIFRSCSGSPPARFFAPRLPSLRRLSLIGFPITWNSPIFANLTSLKLDRGAFKFDRGARSQRASLIHLHNMLERCQSLSALELCGVGPIVDQDAPDIPPATVLSCLRRMRLDMDTDEYNAFRQCVQIPVDSSWDICVAHRPNTPIHPPSFIPGGHAGLQDMSPYLLSVEFQYGDLILSLVDRGRNTPVQNYSVPHDPLSVFKSRFNMTSRTEVYENFQLHDAMPIISADNWTNVTNLSVALCAGLIVDSGNRSA